MVEGFKTLASDPVGALSAMFSEYKDVLERVMSGNATAEDEYFIGNEIGSTVSGLLTGGAIAKTFAKLKKLRKGKTLAKADVPDRPTWQQSEADALSGTDYAKQKSFIDGEEVPYGTKGSVRPEGYKNGASLEVKNYNLVNKNGANNLINNVSKQINQRLDNLPSGTMQNIVVDIRGQNVSTETINKVVEGIKKKANTSNYKIVFKTE